MLKLWGRMNSINVQKVLWCCAELGLEVERTDAGGAFGRPDGYEAMNPTGLVPTIRDADFVLWESNAIVRYLAAKHATGSLHPGDMRAQAAAGQWMDWQINALALPMRTLFQGLIRTAPGERDIDAIEAARRELAGQWRILDGRLAGTEYVAGDRFTMGDIPVGVYAQRWSALPIERQRLPHLEAWADRLRARPGFREHVMQPLS